MLLWQLSRPSLQQLVTGEVEGHIQVCQAHLGALAVGLCAIVSFVKSKSPFLLCYWLRAARGGCPWFACSCPQDSVFEARLLGWDLGKGTGVPCTSSSGKQETGRVVSPVHAKLRASGCFIHAIAKLAFDIYVSLRWSSVTRFHLRRSMLRGCITCIRTWMHTHLHSQTHSPHWSQQTRLVFCTSEKLLFINYGWMEDRFWKRTSVLFIIA